MNLSTSTQIVFDGWSSQIRARDQLKVVAGGIEQVGVVLRRELDRRAGELKQDAACDPDVGERAPLV
jgi:hypothetical protein